MLLSNPGIIPSLNFTFLVDKHRLHLFFLRGIAGLMGIVDCFVPVSMLLIDFFHFSPRKKDLVTYVDNSDDESDDESDEESDASAVETFSRSKGPQKSAGASSSINKPGSNTTQQSSLLQETKNGKAKSNGSKSNKNTVPPVNEDSVPNDGSNITSKYLLFHFLFIS